MQLRWVLLAAGESKRLGQPKQLLKSQDGNPLVLTQAKRLIKTHLPVSVVTGAKADEVVLALGPLKDQLDVLHNENWRQGQGSSVLKAIQAYPTDCLGFVLVDQYRLTTQWANDFAATWRKEPTTPLVTRYGQNDNDWGVPVIVPPGFTSALNDSKKGLKPLLKTASRNTFLGEFAVFDIDTPEDLECFRRYSNS